jgi:hypothetical protein
MVQLIVSETINPLPKATGPADLHMIDALPFAETKVERARLLRQVAPRRMHLADHDIFAHEDMHECSDGIAVALGSLQPEGNVVLLGKVILEVIGSIVEIVGHNIDLAAVAKIRRGRTSRTTCRILATDSFRLKNASSRWLDSLLPGSFHKPSRSLIHHQAIGPIEERISHSRGQEHIFEAVVVEIVCGNAPGPECFHARLDADFLKLPSPEVFEKGISEDHLVILDLERVGESFLEFLGCYFVKLAERAGDSGEARFFIFLALRGIEWVNFTVLAAYR